MKWFKLLLSILGLLVLIFALAVAGFLLFADADKFKSVIIAEVQEKTGYQLIIDGRMSWSIYPRLAIKVDRMLVRAPERSDYFLDARQVRLAADWVSWLQSNQKLRGRVSASRIRLLKMNLENVSADLHWQDGELILDPIAAKLYKGTLRGVVKGQNFFVMPHWQWDMQANGIQLQPLLQDVNNGNAKLTLHGSADFKLQAETRGKNRVEMLNQLNGTGDFNVTDGVLVGVDMNYFIKSAEALIRQDSDILKGVSNDKRTPFSKMTGSFVINHGQAETNNLLLVSRLFSVKGKGEIELLNRVLNMQLQVKPEQNDRIKWYVPILVVGTVSAPEVRLDTMEIQQMMAGQQIEKVKQKALDQIKKHVPGKTGDFLKSLLQ